MVICVPSIFVGMNEGPVQAPFEFRTEVDAIQIVNTTTAPADLVVIGIKGDVVLQRTLAPGPHRIGLNTWATGTYVAIITGPRAGSSTMHFVKH